MSLEVCSLINFSSALAASALAAAGRPSLAVLFLVVLALANGGFYLFLKKDPVRIREIASLAEEAETMKRRLVEMESAQWTRAARVAGQTAPLVFSSASDKLTGAATRRRFEVCLNSMMASTRPFSVLFLDIDYSKKVNDTYGHRAGDDVLRGFARTVSRCLRPEDLLARYGGEEFVVLCRSDPAGAGKVAERIREAVAARPFETCAGPVAVTCSVGVAGRTQQDSMETLLERADRALYAAKNSGRNKVVIAGEN
ncbi:GGDEF domain-containing protein [Desulfofundulus salinus]|uniref:GGDEF domain-containing protein n=1 Tax=Desulfofundulus salinus TaxID=2419843 RepID=A0A494X0N9_9FIRM|nr:GGDEF domain-containing protein [Desulfofundulus salinum]RKO66394.1 GGDEF domain-containing protein [Desulfofundulus salinum]